MEIKQTHVTFEQAKLLKEKGFDNIECIGYYHINTGYTIGYAFCYSDRNEQYDEAILAPEQWQVVEWLRVKHGIWIYIKQGYKWEWFIETIENNPKKIYNDGLEDSPQEAYSAAFDYVFKNLI